MNHNRFIFEFVFRVWGIQLYIQGGGGCNTYLHKYGQYAKVELFIVDYLVAIDYFPHDELS